MTVSIRIPLGSSGWVPPLFTLGREINKSVTMYRERTIADGDI